MGIMLERWAEKQPQFFVTAVNKVLDADDAEQITIVRSGWVGKVTVIYECGASDAWEPELMTREQAESRYDVNLSPLFEGAPTPVETEE